jgi:phosphoribosylpyrophosphate synthetase
VAQFLGVSPLKTTIKTFADTEISVEVLESVRGSDVFIVQVNSRGRLMCPSLSLALLSQRHVDS